MTKKFNVILLIVMISFLSNNLRADRALAGRIVCNQCGMAAGTPIYNSNSRYSIKATNVFNRNMLYFIIFIVIFFIAII